MAEQVCKKPINLLIGMRDLISTLKFKVAAEHTALKFETLAITLQEKIESFWPKKLSHWRN